MTWILDYRENIYRKCIFTPGDTILSFQRKNVLSLQSCVGASSIFHSLSMNRDEKDTEEPQCDSLEDEK